MKKWEEMTPLESLEAIRDRFGGIDAEEFSPLEQIILMYLGMTGDRETAEAAAKELEDWHTNDG